MKIATRTKRGRGGFTLIELLVVVAVIGLLSAIVIASVNTARIRGLNTNRTQAITQLRTAFTMAINDGNTLPFTGGGNACLSTLCTSAFANPTVDAYIASYMPNKPTDDSSRARYGYLYNNSPSFPGVPVGAYLLWYLEPGTPCIPSAYTVYSNPATFTMCALRLEQ